MKIVSSVLGTLAEYTVAPVLRLIHYQSSIGHLDDQIEMLNAQRNGVKLQIDGATSNSETILPEVELWFARVDQTIQDKEKCFEKEKIAKATCCTAGWFSKLKIRHSLSKKAKKMTHDVDSLLDKKFEVVACAVSPPEVRVQPTQHSEDSNALVTNLHEGASSSKKSTTVSFESRKSTIEDLVEALKGNQSNAIVSPPEVRVQHTQNSEDSNALVTNLPEGTSSSKKSTTVSFESRKSAIEDVVEALKGNQSNPIVICGMDGIGKTTMVDEVVSKAKNMGLFNEYAGAVVNDKPNASKIQSDIAKFLSLYLDDEKQDLRARANELRKRLSGAGRVVI